MQTFQQRVVEEKEQLDIKISALDTFIKCTKFLELPNEEQVRLANQNRVMREYSSILEERIKNFVG